MKEALLFFGQAARGWRTTGALSPSGPALSRVLARAVGDAPEGSVILELGPGTGVVTRQLLRHFPRCRVVAVEVLPAFAARLENAFPDVTVVRGCASRLDDHLAGLGIHPESVAAVVSGLPLLTLPNDLPQRILASMTSVLRPGRRLVQLTYSARAWRRFTLDGFHRLSTKRVWLNIPPAHVLTFARNG